MAAGAWYVLRVVTGSEARIARRLRDKDGGFGGLDAFSPMREERELTSAGRMVERLRPLWPSYLFAHWSRGDDATWHQVVGESGLGRIIGVIGIIGGGAPVEIPAPVVEGWIERSNSDGVIIDLAEKLAEMRRGYRRGSEVRIVGGSFDGQLGVCEWVDDRGASIKISLLGRDTLCYVPNAGGVARIVGVGAPASVKTRSRRFRRIVSAIRRAAAA